jgi:DNA-binding transcriptional regulator YdaS (Cro superfamily)
LVVEDESTPVVALERSIAAVGSQTGLAKLIGVSQTAVWKWVRGRKPLPAEHVLKVEKATGISRHELRPDLYPREPAPRGAPPLGDMEPAR